MRSHKDVNFTALANVRIGGSIIAGKQRDVVAALLQSAGAVLHLNTFPPSLRTPPPWGNSPCA
jgi:hypothetical protein